MKKHAISLLGALAGLAGFIFLRPFLELACQFGDLPLPLAIFFNKTSEFFSFFLPAYLVLFTAYYFSKSSRVFILPLAGLGAAIGFVVGRAVSGFVMLILLAVGMYVGESAIIVGAFSNLLTVTLLSYLSILFCIRKESARAETPMNFLFNVLALAVIPVLFAAAILSAHFPRKGSLQERESWMRQKYSREYEAAAEFVRRSPVLNQDIGNKVTCAPLANPPSHIYTSAGNRSALLWLQCVGEKDKGLLFLQMGTDLKTAQSSTILRVYWQFKGEKVQLTPAGMADQEWIRSSAPGGVSRYLIKKEIPKPIIEDVLSAVEKTEEGDPDSHYYPRIFFSKKPFLVNRNNSEFLLRYKTSSDVGPISIEFGARSETFFSTDTLGPVLNTAGEEKEIRVSLAEDISSAGAGADLFKINFHNGKSACESFTVTGMEIIIHPAD